jgi:uncharacterized protein (UPF0332 family)
MGQPSDSEAIFQLAKELSDLAGEEGNEIKLRSAVSRAYYAVFLLARDKMKVTTETEVHTEVIRQVRRQKGQLIGDALYLLKELRRTADYDFPVRNEDHKDWQKNWETASKKGEWLLSKFKL